MGGRNKYCVSSGSGCGHLVGQQLGLPGSCEDVCPGKAQPVIVQRLDQLRNVEQDVILEGGREGEREGGRKARREEKGKGIGRKG